jgi:hypothetical protein
MIKGDDEQKKWKRIVLVAVDCPIFCFSDDLINQEELLL